VATSFPSRSPAPRSRVSHRRYVARRIGVAAVALLLVAGLVWSLTALLGGKGEGVAEGGSPGSSPPGSSPGATSGTAPTVTASAHRATTTTSTTTTTTTVPDTGPPSAENPARVLVVGDSDAGTFAPYLETLLDDTGVVDTIVDYKVSSGLARPDFFDWPAHLRRQLPAIQPDVVVVTFGGNDAQGLARADGSFLNGDPVVDREEWLPEYSRRAGEVMDLLAADGRTVIWVGIPNDDNPEVTARLQVQDEAVRDALASRPDVVFVDTWARFSSLNGGWAQYVVDPRDNQGKPVRAADGFHLNENGAEILAIDIANVVRTDLESRGAPL
jgi:uncharacterized protein